MERQNEETRQKAGFSGGRDFESLLWNLGWCGTRNRPRDLLITSDLSFERLPLKAHRLERLLLPARAWLAASPTPARD